MRLSFIVWIILEDRKKMNRPNRLVDHRVSRMAIKVFYK